MPERGRSALTRGKKHQSAQSETPDQRIVQHGLRRDELKRRQNTIMLMNLVELLQLQEGELVPRLPDHIEVSDADHIELRGEHACMVARTLLKLLPAILTGRSSLCEAATTGTDYKVVIVNAPPALQIFLVKCRLLCLIIGSLRTSSSLPLPEES